MDELSTIKTDDDGNIIYAHLKKKVSGIIESLKFYIKCHKCFKILVHIISIETKKVKALESNIVNLKQIIGVIQNEQNILHIKRNFGIPEKKNENIPDYLLSIAIII